MNKFRKYYLPRDISWMYFNHRILQEAKRDEVPLLERIKFMGIYANNLEEFFRVRIASLKRIAEFKDKSTHNESKEAHEILKKIYSLNKEYNKEYLLAINNIEKELNKNQIYFLDENEFDRRQKEFVEYYYQKNLYGFIYPIWINNIKSFVNDNDYTFYMAVKMTGKDKDDVDYSVIGLPYSGKNRFIELPSVGENKYYIYIEDVIRFCLPNIFKNTHFKKFEGYTFTFSKDAEMEIDNDINEDILEKISKAIKIRKRGEPIRIIHDKNMPKDLLDKIIEKFDVDKLDSIEKGGRYQNYKDLISFPTINDDRLVYKEWEPINKKSFVCCKSIIEELQHKDMLLHVPYHDFDGFIRLMYEASFDKNVKEIKISLYRLAKDSKVIKALINAAHNGIKVTVVIELMARFDEASNISWSKQMQEAGIKVEFGVEGLKIHSKILYINMNNKEKDIACISTGNFHEGNASVYTDVILMTTNKRIVKDVKDVFEFISKPYMRFNPKELLVSPNKMKSKIITLINREIKNKQEGKEAYIKVKINHVTDETIIKKLYEASSKGVKIDMLVRGNCSLYTGVKELSENITIKGIIDRYLEHSRIFIFCNDGDEKIFMGSSDWMPRNLDHRIEVVTPIYDEDIKKEMRLIVDYGLKDNVQAREVDGLGNNEIIEDVDACPFRSQNELYNHYKE